jgi:CRISPR-associated protein Cas8a1/Csx13
MKSGDTRRFTNTYLGRVVGGAEEAGLKFLVDLKAQSVSAEPSVRGCQAIAMGKVAWDRNQLNRSVIVKLRDDYAEMDVFTASLPLGESRVVTTKDGPAYAVPASPLPELVAANLASDRPWCFGFASLVAEKKEFNQLRFLAQKGLKAMAESVKDETDRAVIRAFQEAWRATMGMLGDRATRERSDPNRLFEVERERIRNEILRAKTSEALASWFVRFCANASRRGPLKMMQEESERIRKFIFDRREFARFQSLCLFALVSYTSDAAKTSKEGEK